MSYLSSNRPENDEKDFKSSEKPTLQEVIHDLTSSEDSRIPTSAYYGLSNLSADEVSLFEPYWNKLDTSFKVKILTEFAEASEINFEFDYQSIGYLAIEDADSAVRTKAIDVLWIDESAEFLSRLIEMAETDESTEVRAAAASEIGRFILLGEYGDIAESEANRAQDVVINLLNDSSEDLEVRRRSLEAISNSSLDFVSEAIREAYESDERLMKVSAIFAMGRSYDDQWTDIIMREIHSDDPEIRYEATRSAGELEIEEAVNLLGQIAVVDEREIRQVAIWSLGEIGGSQAMRLLTALGEDAREAEDEDLLEAIEDAIGFASMSGSDLDFDFEDEDE